MAEWSDVGPVPRVLRYVSAAAVVVGVVVMFLGAWRIGVTWDEPIHVQRLNTYLHTGWFLGDGQLQNGAPRATLTQQFVYAPVTMLLLHALAVGAGVEHWHAAEVTADAYVVRHLGIAIIGVLGILAVVGLGRLVFRRWDWALVAGAAAAAIPMWTGYSMFNLKDVPVGTGYTVVTLGLAILARSAQGNQWRIRLAGPACIATGTLLAVGTRPGIWPGLAAGTALLVACLALRPGAPFFTRLRGDIWRYRDLLLGYAVAGVGLYAVDPKVFGSPVHALVRSAFASGNFLGVRSPWTFVPLGVFLQMPALMLAFTAVAVWASTRRLIRVRFRPDVVETRILLVAAQVFVLPVLAIVHRAALYGDLRQILFAAPATAVLVTLGINRAVGAARASRDGRTVPMVAAIACVALVAPLVEQTTLFPYNYTYYNALANIANVPIMGDYYRASGREIAPDLPRDGRLVCSAAVDDDRKAMRMAHLDGWFDCRTSEMSPIAPYLSRGDGRDLGALAADQFWDVNFGSLDAPKNCQKVATVTRRLRWTRLAMSTLWKCTRPFQVLSNATLRMSDTDYQALSLFDLGWLLPQTDGSPIGVLSRDVGGASLTFRLARSFAGHDVTILIDTAWRSPVPQATFGGTAVRVTETAGTPGLSVAVPRALVDRATTEALTLAFSPPASGPLDLKVMRIRAVVAGQS